MKWRTQSIYHNAKMLPIKNNNNNNNLLVTILV